MKNIGKTVFATGSAVFRTLEMVPPARFSSLDELRARGYEVKHKSGDPFSYADAVIVKDCLKRCAWYPHPHPSALR